MPQVEKGQFSTEGSVHLDALRGLAALVVVLGHTRSLYFSSTASSQVIPAPHTAAEVPPGSIKVPNPAAPIMRAKITIGNEAVMIFFVLSGFLVGGSVLRSFRKHMVLERLPGASVACGLRVQALEPAVAYLGKNRPDPIALVCDQHRRGSFDSYLPQDLRGRTDSVRRVVKRTLPRQKVLA